MNEKRKRFCREYAASGNATQAAIKAGYSQRTAKSQGQRLLTFADVQTMIEGLTEEVRAEKIANIERIQEFWTSVFFERNGQDCGSARGVGTLGSKPGGLSYGCQ